MYAEKSGEKLYLDHYAAPREGLRPCVMFLFGGAFARGDRAHEDYAPYFDMLTSAGYDVVSIDYRLGMKDAKGVLTWGEIGFGLIFSVYSAQKNADIRQYACIFYDFSKSKNL